MIITPEEKHTQLYKDILEILKANFYPLGEVDDDAQCAEMIAKYFEGYWNEAKLKEELMRFCAFKVSVLPSEPVLLENYVDEYLNNK